MKNRLKRYQEGGEVEPTENIPSEAHLRAVAFIDEMLGTMMSSNTALTPVVKLMHRARPAILRDLSQIPAEQLQSFLVDLGTRMIKAGTPIPQDCHSDFTNPSLELSTREIEQAFQTGDGWVEIGRVLPQEHVMEDGVCSCGHETEVKASAPVEPEYVWVDQPVQVSLPLPVEMMEGFYGPNENNTQTA